MKKEYFYETTPAGEILRHESGPSFMDISGGVIVQTPLCKVCLKHDEDNWTCKVYGQMPKDYRHCIKYDCPHFMPDKENELYGEVEKELNKQSK